MKFHFQFSVILLIIAVTSCQEKKSYNFEKIESPINTQYYLGYELPCDFVNGFGNAELNAVRLALHGETEKSVDEAARRRKESGNFGGEVSIADSAISMFQNSEAVDAISLISKMSSRYHFTLINEAHFSSQNRAFTEDLLSPLWKQGYRYLALEALSHIDTNLVFRGYPVIESGYYCQDSHFGNMIRTAISMGYKTIPYETKRDVDGRDRDFDQANNIISQTILNDSIGKVLVHAGYSHIIEHGDNNYKSLGYFLKEIVKEDILTVDQERMIPYNSNHLNHDYLNYVLEEYNPTKPLIFLNRDSTSIRDFIYSHMIDLQVYHPKTNYINGRPDWMIKEKKFIPLPQEIISLDGYHIRAFPVGEDPAISIPVDQFKIDGEKELVLANGDFLIQILDCERRLHSSYTLIVE